MRNYWFVFLILSIAPVLVEAADIPYNDYWQKGNKFYEARSYDSALHYYSLLAAAEPDAAEVYYNLGNTHYRLNNIGEAVLYYSRALNLRPGYSEAADNLELTQSRIKNRIPAAGDIFFIRWWNMLISPAIASIWAVAGLVLFFILLFLLYTRRSRVRYANQLLGLTVVLFLISVTLAYFSAGKASSHHYAVVMRGENTFRPEGPAKKVEMPVPEGTIVVMEPVQVGEWQTVTLPDGRTGRMERSALEKI